MTEQSARVGIIMGSDSDLPIMASLVGMPYRRLISQIMRSALARCPAPRPKVVREERLVA